MPNVRSLIIAIALLSLVCGSGPPTAAEIKLFEGLVYATRGETPLPLDLAVPSGAGPFPAIVFIHGGGWYLGDRRGHRDDIEEAAKRGFVAAAITYRLMQFDEAQKHTTQATPIFPAQIHDAKAAIRWLRANATTYHIDSDRIGVTGASAGGHLSLMVGLTDETAELEGEGDGQEVSSRVQAVVNVFGPTEMSKCQQSSSVSWIFRLFMGGTPDEVPETYAAASPLSYVTRDDPPVLTMHGERDALVTIEQARLLDARMKEVGAPHKLMVYADQGHGFRGPARQDSQTAMWDFFEQHLKP